MHVQQLIELYVPKYYFHRKLSQLAEQERLHQIELDNSINTFLNKLNNGLEIKSEEFEGFFINLDALNKNIKDILLEIIFEITDKIYEEHEKEIKITIKEIDDCLNASRPIRQRNQNSKKYMGLINLYHLFKQDNFLKSLAISPYQRKVLNYYIPFAINALTLTGKLPKANYNGINTAQALYPLNLEIAQENKIPIKRGIKISSEYFPYKFVYKIYKGNTGNNTFLATNGHKVLFLRSAEQYSPMSIMTSKIASLISAKYFSSERLMDNKIAASKKINTYVCSVIDPEIRELRKHHIEIEKKVFPGTGLIDEVSNYVKETDYNAENLGLSSKKLEKAHLSKIDFDRCDLLFPLTKEQYEFDIVSKPMRGIYHELQHVQHNKTYINEKLFARLKLSLLTEALLGSLADKAFIDRNHGIKKKVIKECCRRSDIALELFIEHKEARAFIKSNPKILIQCYMELVSYIKKHFEKTIQQNLIDSVYQRIELIHKKLVEHLKIEILNSPEKEKKLSSTHYQHQIVYQQQGRPHFFETQGNEQLGSDFSKLKGDYLKSQILLKFKEEIEAISSEDALVDYINKLKKDRRRDILATPQGITTSIFRLETSAINALNQMLEEQQIIIQENIGSIQL